MKRRTTGCMIFGTTCRTHDPNRRMMTTSLPQHFQEHMRETRMRPAGSTGRQASTTANIAQERRLSLSTSEDRATWPISWAAWVSHPAEQSPRATRISPCPPQASEWPSFHLRTGPSARPQARPAVLALPRQEKCPVAKMNQCRLPPRQIEPLRRSFHRQNVLLPRGDWIQGSGFPPLPGYGATSLTLTDFGSHEMELEDGGLNWPTNLKRDPG